MELSYLKVVRPNSELTVRGKLVEVEKNKVVFSLCISQRKSDSQPKVVAEVGVYNNLGELCVQGRVAFFPARPEILRSVIGEAVDRYLPQLERK